MTDGNILKKKKELRAQMRLRLAELPEAHLSSAGAAIEERVLSSALYAEARSVFLYVSMPGEPPTRRILRQALEDGKRVYVPRCAGREMKAVRIRDAETLRPGALGIPEPDDAGETAEAKELDLILVPCVCASGDGIRLGHGGGYYDRFLSGTAERAVCLCFERMLTDGIPTEETDVRIPRVITEERGSEADG